MTGKETCPCKPVEPWYKEKVGAETNDNRRQIDFTNYRLHVPMYLLSNRSQMTSKCSKNKKEEDKAIVECQ